MLEVGLAPWRFQRGGIFRDVGTGGHWGHVPPPRFCNKQRSALFIFRKCPFRVMKKVPLKCGAPPSLNCFLRPWVYYGGEGRGGGLNVAFQGTKKSSLTLMCWPRRRFRVENDFLSLFPCGSVTWPSRINGGNETLRKSEKVVLLTLVLIKTSRSLAVVQTEIENNSLEKTGKTWTEQDGPKRLYLIWLDVIFWHEQQKSRVMMKTTIAEFVKEAKCCARCLSRIFNHRNVDLLGGKETTSTASRDITHTATSNETKLQNCSQCLGLLEGSFIDSCIEKVCISSCI
eukprot:Seg282.14 transcript_id=Seg282.14/GoldUCD/mRNA.D3Y31 product="hypothetical protein" protein_id=Seg282.14/GoldUCD/D3Y31